MSAIIFEIPKKPNLTLVLLHIVLEENKTIFSKTTCQKTQFDIAAWQSYFWRNLATDKLVAVSR